MTDVSASWKNIQTFALLLLPPFYEHHTWVCCRFPIIPWGPRRSAASSTWSRDQGKPRATHAGFLLGVQSADSTLQGSVTQTHVTGVITLMWCECWLTPFKGLHAGYFVWRQCKRMPAGWLLPCRVWVSRKRKGGLGNVALNLGPCLSISAQGSLEPGGWEPPCRHLKSQSYCRSKGVSSYTDFLVSSEEGTLLSLLLSETQFQIEPKRKFTQFLTIH